jgi:hypothetical protein
MGSGSCITVGNFAGRGVGQAVAHNAIYQRRVTLRSISPVRLFAPMWLSLLWLASLTGVFAQAVSTIPEADAAAQEAALKVELRDVITSWASAWQSQLDDVYLLHYHSNFKPEGFASRDAWTASRRSQVKDPADIRISLREFAVVAHDSDTALVRFWLAYSRPGYADRTHKEMLLQKERQIWRISREHNIEVVREALP